MTASHIPVSFDQGKCPEGRKRKTSGRTCKENGYRGDCKKLIWTGLI